jgi:pimeloyl-ACP methyl ester carboxylesterase
MTADPAQPFAADSSPPGAIGPPLVLVHGSGGTHRSWPEELRALPGRRVLALDLPGHGASPGPALTTVEAMAECVLRLIEARGLGAAVIGGHSLGGAVALAAALRAPERVAGLVLVGTGARLRVLPAVLQATADAAALSQAAASLAAACFGPAAAPQLVQSYAEELRSCAPGVAHADFAACDGFDVIGRLGEVRAPTLVVCGGEDRMTPPKYAELLRARIAGARLTLVAGAGHFVMQEARAETAGAVAGFLGALAGSPPPG